MKTKPVLMYCATLAAALAAADPKPGIPVELRAAAERGEAKAQYEMGLAYTRGQVVALDHAQAAIWYLKAVAQGYGPAESAMAFRYSAGRGVPKDPVEALRLYRSAAEKGVRRAQATLGMMLMAGRAVARDYAGGISWLRKAADQGEANAQRELGVAYVDGRGVPQDLIPAYAWLKLAGDDQFELKPNMTSETRAQVKRRHEYFRSVEKKLTAEQRAEAEKFVAARRGTKTDDAEAAEP